MLAAFFEWGVASHDLDFEAIKKGEKSKEQIRRELKGMARKGRQQIIKDYIAWPRHQRAGRRASSCAAPALAGRSGSPLRRREGAGAGRLRRRARRASCGS